MAILLFLPTIAILQIGQVTSPSAPDRAAVIAALRHQEGLVKTLQVDYQYRLLPTPPAQAARIRTTFGKYAEAYQISEEVAKYHSGSARFWRKGAKQRDEWTLLAGDQADQYKTTFNGEIFRSVREGSGVSTGVIATAKTSDWYAMPREDPMALLYLHYERPFSAVVSEAVDFSSSVVNRGNERLYRVLVKCAPKGLDALEFLFDERFRQIERVFKLVQDPRSNRLVNNHKVVFSGYKEYDILSGEKIWFPEKAILIGYAMDRFDADGSQLEVTWKDFHFTKVEFNQDMPDSLFELEIPKNAKINDLVTGAGWLSPGKRPAALFPAEARSRRIRVAAVVLAALLGVTAAVFWRRRRMAMGA